MSNKILVLFDFCETLVNFQTADPYLNQIYTKNKSVRGELIEIIRKIFNGMNLLTGQQNKKLLLLKLKGLSEKKFEDFASDYLYKLLISNTISYTIEKLKWHQLQGHTVVIISGGYQQYLKMFAAKFNINIAIGTEIEFENNKASGNFQGLNCMEQNKLSKLAATINLAEYNLLDSYCYTDSLSDLPILGLVGNRILINNQEKNINWLKHYNILEVNTND